MIERLRPRDCPVELILIRGPDQDLRGFSRNRARLAIRSLVDAQQLGPYVSLVDVDIEAPPGDFWQVAAYGAPSHGAPLHSLVFMNHESSIGQDLRVFSSPDSSISIFDWDFDLDFFDAQVGTWLTALLPPTERSTSDDLMRSAVEVLLRELQVRILDNALVLAQLEENEAVNAQLRAQIEFLETELRRLEPEPGRIRAAVSAVRNLLTSTKLNANQVIAAGTAVMALATVAVAVEGAQRTPTPPAPKPGVEFNIGDQWNYVVNVCDDVLKQVEAQNRTT